MVLNSSLHFTEYMVSVVPFIFGGRLYGQVGVQFLHVPNAWKNMNPVMYRFTHHHFMIMPFHSQSFVCLIYYLERYATADFPVSLCGSQFLLVILRLLLDVYKLRTILSSKWNDFYHYIVTWFINIVIPFELVVITATNVVLRISFFHSLIFWILLSL